jgi:ParB family transcriptional regulator, chromosome partitioning protein
MATKKTKGLGRGLEALLGADKAALDDLGAKGTPLAGLTELSIEQLQAGKYQPRTLIDQDSIKALAQSIEQQGIMQPIIVRVVGQIKDERFEVIAGERRLRAAQLAGLTKVPVIIKDVDDEQSAIMALIENIQREDLNPLEEAKGLRRLLDEFAFTHDQIAGAIGRSRSATSNLLRLLNLAEPVQGMLLNGQLDMGHARALLSLEAADQIQAANVIIAQGLSVRDTEKLVAKGLHTQQKRARNPETTNRDMERMQEALADKLGTTVALRANIKGRGQVTFKFHDWEQFQGLLEKMSLSNLLDQA